MSNDPHGVFLRRNSYDIFTFFVFCRKFEDIFDVDHFIDYLKDDVPIIRDIPEWFTDKSELFTSIRLDCLLNIILVKFLFFLSK